MNLSTFFLAMTAPLLGTFAVSMPDDAASSSRAIQKSESADSVTVTVQWTLTNTTTNKDAIGSFAIYNDRGYYQYFNSTALNKFSTTRSMPVRVPRQGTYTMIMHYTNKRPAASTMKKYIIREKVELASDTVMAFAGKECTQHIGFDFTLPGGLPLKFMYKNGTNADWSEATAVRATFQSKLVAKDQPAYDWAMMSSVTNGTSSTGNDRAKINDIYVNPGISDNFEYMSSVIAVMVDTADAAHNPDPQKPLVIISHRVPLATSAKETVHSNSDSFTRIIPDTIKPSLYPVKDAHSKWGYNVLLLNTEKNAAIGNVITGSVANAAGEVACWQSEKSNPMLLTLHQFETDAVRYGCVQSGCGISHLPLYIAPGKEPVMAVTGNIGQGYAYNTLDENLLFTYKMHPFYSYSPAEQKIDYGNTAPFMAFTVVPSTASPLYMYQYPMNISNGDWIGNGGEQRCVDLFSDGIAVIAGRDTIATEWSKLSTALAAFEKTDHDPVEIRIIFDNTNFTVDDMPGHSRAEYIYRENDTDVCPPSLTMMQMRDKSGRITNRFDRLADAEIYFNAADLTRPSSDFHLTRQPVTVKAEIASRNSENYTTLTVQDYSANSAMPVWGDGYRIDLSQYEHYNIDGWFRLRFTVTDAAGNRCIQTISPALYARGSANGIGDITALPLRVWLEGNLIMAEGTDQAVISVYSMSGNILMSGKGNSLDITSLPAAIYMVQARGEGNSVTAKILKR